MDATLNECLAGSVRRIKAAELAAQVMDGKHVEGATSCFESVRLMLEHLCLGGEVTGVEPHDDVAAGLDDAALSSSPRAEGQGKARVFVADHGTDVIWRVVGGRADRLAGRAIDRHAGRVIGVVLHGRNDPHTTSREGIAVDVGDIIRDLAVVPGELELGDGTRLAVFCGKLDGHADTLLAVGLAVATLELLHAGVGTSSHGCVVDSGATVVDDGGASHGGDTNS